MDSVCRCRNPHQLPTAGPTLDRKFAESPKADNLLKTKGNFFDFCLSKAENILKTRQLLEMQKNGLIMEFDPLPE
jgi:hypothetical protein